ncbi:MAG: hypothetical protein IPP47_25250 [Bryobacterales bacterium]|nr:hypothetical protein [Bryobacterales bacterium]
MTFDSVLRSAAASGASIALCAASMLAQPIAGKPGPVTGKASRYINPLSIETSSRDGSPQGVNLGDVTVLKSGDFYYLFGTGGGAWVSKNFLDWKYQALEVRGGRLPVAPHVVEYNGAFYMSGNDAPLYKAPAVLGPYEVLGPWKNEKGEPWTGVSNGKSWKGAFDVDIFIDDDNKPYLYFFSMTASKGDSAPRGIEFHFDKHRLNVAISRSQILAVIVASPKLERR